MQNTLVVQLLEHYKKTQSCYYDDPCAPNELRITGTGKSHDICTRATHQLKDNHSEGIVISASGNHVTKAVTIVELLKRKLKGLHQDTQIKFIRVEDIWEPDQEGLDTLKVTRHIPAISVHLTINETNPPSPHGGEVTQKKGEGHSGGSKERKKRTSTKSKTVPHTEHS